MVFIYYTGDPDKGNRLTVFVIVTDQYGAKSRRERTVTVNPSVVDESKFNNASQDVQNAIAQGNIQQAVGM